MTQHETASDQLPCATSSLHQPEEVDGMVNADRLLNIAGDCIPAARVIRELGLPHGMIQRCPILLEDYKRKGAPQSATCIAALMLFAAATHS